MHGGVLSLAVAFSLAVPPSVWARPHLVVSSDVSARFEAVAAERTAHRLKVDGLLAMPVAAEIAAARGLDIETLRRGVATLRDDELRDLAARADALSADPAAGGAGSLLVIVLVVVALAVVLAILVVKDCKEKGAACYD